MAAENYELIEHTADIGIRVKGSDMKELFQNAALAMFNIIAQRKEEKSQRIEEIEIIQKADDAEELFVNWLNELLSLSATKELIFLDFQINKLDENTLQALVMGRDIKDYKVNTEIKAATYHQLEIRELDTGWQAQIIFDV